MLASRVHRDVKARGVRLRVAVTGDGAPVILLHGLFAHHRTWDSITDELASDFKLVAPDLPGFGQSEKPPASRFAYNVDAFAEAITDLYAGLELGRSAIVGHGLGGAIALQLAAQHPELVSRLILVDSLCYQTPVDLRRRIALLPIIGGFIFKQLWGRSTFRGFYRDMVWSRPDSDERRINDYYAAFNTPASRGSALATMRATADTRSVIAQTARVSSPTLVIWGRHDRLFPAALGQRLAKEIRGAGFELMNTGNAPHEEAPAAFAEVLGRFLRAERPSRF